MTIDERIERLEHITAGYIEQSRKEMEENRRLWREQREEIAAIWKATDRRFAEVTEQFRETDRRLAQSKLETDQRFRETDERFRATDDRIDKLVSAIGELVRRLDAKNA